LEIFFGESVQSYSSKTVQLSLALTSFRPHSHYTRIIQDLPIGEKTVSLLLISRKWFCDNPICDRKIFTERYDWIAENGRRTTRAESVLREIAFSSSCLNGEKLARTVYLSVSHDTLLSIIKKTEINPVVSPFRRHR
jgi:transposase